MGVHSSFNREQQYMFIMIQFASFFLFILSISSARSFAPRETCPPKPPTIPEFNATNYLGNWYQYEGLPAFFAPSGTSCIRATYGDRGDGSVSVRNVDVSPSGKYEQICGYAEIPDPSHPGELKVYFPFAPAGDYWILGTDYENYASVYYCQSLLVFKIEFAWVLVRDPNPSEEILEMNSGKMALKLNLRLSAKQIVSMTDLMSHHV